MRKLLASSVVMQLNAIRRHAVPHIEEILEKPQRFGEPALISRIGS
jgi:hypothetical protein